MVIINKLKILFLTILCFATIGNAACGLANARADETQSNHKAEPVATRNKTSENSALRNKPDAEPKIGGVPKNEKSASGEKTARQRSAEKTTEVAFENLADFINDEENHRAGERFVVRDVPTAKIENVSAAVEATGNPAHQGLFALDFNQGADGSGTFLTSKTLVRNLQANGSSEAATLRVTAILVETAGDVDVYRSVYVTKIEGLDENGESIWAATGDQPRKVRFGF